MQKLVSGFLRFHDEVFPAQKELFKNLKYHQAPRALFITCSDSRLVPTLVTQTDPGELFICRNAGNIVPPYGDTMGGVSATIEYAVKALHVPNIIICGHSNCGAMAGVLHREKLEDMPVVRHWLNMAESARQIVNTNYPDASDEQKMELLSFENVVAQLENLRTHPSVSLALARGEVRLFGWVFDIESGDIHAYNAETGEFEKLTGENVPEATPPPRRRLKLAEASVQRS
jgi:carbonic anhydrase